MTKEDLQLDANKILTLDIELKRKERKLERNLRHNGYYLDSFNDVKKKEYTYCIERKIDRIVNKDTTYSLITKHKFFHDIIELTKKEMEFVSDLLCVVNSTKVSKDMFIQLKNFCETKEELDLIHFITDEGFFFSKDLKEMKSIYNADTDSNSYVFNLKNDYTSELVGNLTQDSYIKLYRTSKDVIKNFIGEKKGDENGFYNE